VCAGLAASAANAQFAIVNNIPGSFTDITTMGGTFVVGGDDASGPVAVSAAVANLAFPPGTLGAATNGNVGYGTDTTFTNAAIPSGTFYGGATAAAVFWDDLITQAGPNAGVYKLETTEGGVPVLIIQWNNMDHYFTSASTATFEIKIFGGAGGPGGALAQFIYNDVDFGDATLNNGASATIGYQYDGSNGVQYSFNTATVQAGTVLTLTGNPGPTGACCHTNGTCSIRTAASCAAAGGTYRGDGVTCANANCPPPAVYKFQTNLPGTFTDISATGSVITSGDDSSVAFTSGVTNALLPSASLFASTNGNITNLSFATFTNAALPVSTLNRGLFPFWDDLYVDTASSPPGSLKHQTVVENGINVEVIQWDHVRTFAGGPGSGQGTFEVKIFGSGPVLAQYIYQDVASLGGGSANGASATVGAQWDASLACMYSLNASNLSNGLVVSVLNGAGPTGACCLRNGTCTVATLCDCTSQGGLYRGDGVACANANCPPPCGSCVPGGVAEGEPNCGLPDTVNGGCNSTPPIFGSIGLGQAVCGTAAFDGTTRDTDWYQFTLAAPTAVTLTGKCDFDALAGIIDGNLGCPAGTVTYPIFPGACSDMNLQVSLPAGTWWVFVAPQFTEVIPCGRTYWVGLNFTAVTCYPNCDHSTTPPCLNVGDFGCFLNAFAAGDTYANCDGSTMIPVLTVQDFGCFLNSFAAGCGTNC
jgi:hypothetical protein